MSSLHTSTKHSPLSMEPAKLIAANINPKTHLATDYLNHYNEIVMLLELLKDMPDMVEDVLAWQPKSYPQHFADSGFKERDLAIAAYQAAPRDIKCSFDTVCAEIDTTLLATLDELRSKSEEEYGLVGMLASTNVRPLIDAASGIINGMQEELDAAAFDMHDHATAAQGAIDALFAD